MTKRKLLLLSLALFSAPMAYAAGTQNVPTAVQRQRKNKIVAHLVKALPGYAEGIVSNPLFVFEPRIVRRYERLRKHPSATPSQPKPGKHDFDYVVNAWARQEGSRFMELNEAVLASAEAQFLTIPREIPTGILDAETQFGTVAHKADYPIVQTLLAIAVFQPDFQGDGWAEGQLISFLRISRRTGWDPFLKTGSRTGAMGKPQFEPSSYEALAMHWDGTSCELWKTSAVPADLDDNEDALCSVFNYLHANGFGGGERRWRRVLHRYNHDWAYCDAILDIADFLAGRPDHRHYQRVAERTSKRKSNVPQPTPRAATQ